MKTFHDLIVWQKSFQLTLDIYQLTNLFPKEEIYGLTSQIRRASVSIPANIAEGFGRRSKKEYGQFLRIAYASGTELETELLLAQQLHYGNQKNYPNILSSLTEVMKMLYVLELKVIDSLTS